MEREIVSLILAGLISEIAYATYSLIFRNDKPIPHILLRDYAREVLEYALNMKAISSEINPEKFRPPYKSSPELKNPSVEEIEKLDGDGFSSLVKSSLMGFPGDFGNDTMACVYNWSSTPLSASKVENGIELKERFANEQLTGDVQKEYLKKIEQLKTENTSRTLEKI